ncbi:ATP-dependent DNA helicase PcrA [Paenibacillus vortex V453]|jgi:DNA helicase-2/ATP-dependent DNA helicase PcrA|uniref:ATP-dependent DNA helicase n=2 Tax=Paenibacillus TaxID=44249 RepID=A0A163HUK8_9BACL|nr:MULTISPECIES: DNA helicase PcrA [Paenibacillus]ANA79715.1 ATP-dependent DNA helicase PcrA [Paenibacillus glucanolyticus]AVV56262.1 DNA helicase PcrA [Paenibacillus glucanolyticus]AWP25497.1 DNA helicase PcrA [Paenibacillus sp. Cedars]EFU38110.1 ATP-dependent DNA helicase PcrA [Paenibacillus vortex V453]ETT34066.1 ATP-dependent DNA helicase PcrA [Paenibacillus sp. FSL R5-808]
MQPIDIHEAVKRLNPEQRKAVEATDGPLLIMAGAGSGKTRVLTHRIGYLIATRKAAPWSILAITFTNKAAREMQERVSKLVGREGQDIWVSTFHSMCVRILRKDIERIGFTSNFSILDSTDQLSVIRNVMKHHNIDPKKFEPKAVQAAMSAAKNELISPQQYEQKAGDYFESLVAKVYTEYQKRLKSNNSLDFDDLIMTTIQLFKEVPEVLDFYQRKFQYIHVDEYQDTNRAQYMLCRMLADSHHRICVVGDSDQSIYRWRGADITNILNFEQDYPEARTILLEQNYRSTANILNAANNVIGLNTGRKPKNLWTEQGEGPKIKVFRGDTEHDEGYFVTSEISKNINAGKNYQDHAILYRTNAQSRVIEEILIKSDIPYQIVGGIKFYDRKEIKDMLAYLRLISNPDDDISLTRIINVPKRSIGDTTVAKLAAAAGERGISIFRVLEIVDDLGFAGRTRNALVGFYDMIAALSRMVEFLSVTELTEKILEMSEYRLELQNENTIESRSRLENIDEFLSVTQEFEKNNEDKSLISFLTDLALIADIDSMNDDEEDRDDAVVLMTMHSAKGLEFPVVFIIGMEEGVFPHSRAFMDNEELEEERRLAYVGITRAEKQLFLSCARMRTLFGRTTANPPSRFLEEIPEELKEDTQMAHDRYRRGGSGSVGGSYAGRGFGGGGGSNFGGGRSVDLSLSGSTASAQAAPKSRVTMTTGAASRPASASGSGEFKAGDKVAHGKWGTGTIVAVKGSGNDMELQIAFPAPVGVKRLLAGFAPITKVE